jgi:hypothetical protein
MQSARSATRLADNPPCSRVGADQHGHPARRSEHATYGGLEPRPGWERDHCLPLRLGGADAAGNVWYQPIAEAQRKDLVEPKRSRWCAAASYRSHRTGDVPSITLQGGVNLRTVQRWASGTEEPAPGVWRDLLAAIDARRVRLSHVRDELARHPSLSDSERPSAAASDCSKPLDLLAFLPLKSDF